MNQKPDFDEARDLIIHWHENTKRNARGHFISSEILQFRHYFLGITATLVAAIVGSGVLTDLVPKYKILISLLSVLTIVLSSLQTFLMTGKAASRHAVAATGFNALRREMQQELALFDREATNPAEVVTRFRKKMDALAKESPLVLRSAWKRANKEIETKHRQFAHRSAKDTPDTKSDS